MHTLDLIRHELRIIKKHTAILEEILGTDQQIKEVLNVVSEHFKVTVDAIKSPIRRQPLPDARKIISKILKSNVRLKDEEIGKIISRDRTSVIDAIEAFNNLEKADSVFRRHYNGIMKDLKFVSHEN